MKIVIAGAGEVGTHLAKMLSQENQDIILRDQESGLVRKCYSRGDYQCDGLYVGS